MFELKEDETWGGYWLIRRGNDGHMEINMNFYEEDLVEIQKHGLESEKGQEVAHEVYLDVLEEYHND